MFRDWAQMAHMWSASVIENTYHLKGMICAIEVDYWKL